MSETKQAVDNKNIFLDRDQLKKEFKHIMDKSYFVEFDKILNFRVYPNFLLVNLRYDRQESKDGFIVDDHISIRVVKSLYDTPIFREDPNLIKEYLHEHIQKVIKES